MKSILILALVMTGSMALANDPIVSCKAKNLKLTYVPNAGFAGASLTIESKVRNHPVKINAAAKDISSMANVIGNQLTVQNPAGTIVDAQTSYYTVVIPDIHLEGNTTVSFPTVIVSTVVKSTIAGPAGVKGVVQSSTYTPAVCTAH